MSVILLLFEEMAEAAVLAGFDRPEMNPLGAVHGETARLDSLGLAGGHGKKLVEIASLAYRHKNGQWFLKHEAYVVVVVD